MVWAGRVLVRYRAMANACVDIAARVWSQPGTDKKQARPDGDIRAGRVDRRGGGWGRTRRSQPFSVRGANPPRGYCGFLFLIPLFLIACGSCVRSSRWSRGAANGFKGRSVEIRHRTPPPNRLSISCEPGIACARQTKAEQRQRPRATKGDPCGGVAKLISYGVR